MIQLFLILFMLISGYCWASAPSSSFTYVPGTTIIAAQVQTNENNIYTYLQSGVDTYKAGSISQVAISPTAGILYSQLNLSGGILPSDFNTVTTTSVYQLENILVPATGNITDNGTLNLGTTNTGDVLSDNGVSIVRVAASASTNGMFLKSNGNSSASTWATPSLYTFSSSSPSGVSSFTIPGLSPGVRYRLILNLLQNTAPGIPEITFNGDSGSHYISSNGVFENNTVSSYASGTTTFFYITPNNPVDTATYAQYEILFQTVQGNNNKVIFSSTSSYVDTNYSSGSGGGIYSGTSQLSSLTFTTSGGTVTGTATVYSMQ